MFAPTSTVKRGSETPETSTTAPSTSDATTLQTPETTGQPDPTTSDSLEAFLANHAMSPIEYLTAPARREILQPEVNSLGQRIVELAQPSSPEDHEIILNDYRLRDGQALVRYSPQSPSGDNDSCMEVVVGVDEDGNPDLSQDIAVIETSWLKNDGSRDAAHIFMKTVSELGAPSDQFDRQGPDGSFMTLSSVTLLNGEYGAEDAVMLDEIVTRGIGDLLEFLEAQNA